MKGMDSKHFAAAIWLSSSYCISGVNCFAATAYTPSAGQQLVRKRRQRCSQAMHYGVLHSQGDATCESDSLTGDDNRSCYEQRVAVLLPDSSLEADDGDNVRTNWQHDAIQQLRQIGENSKLSFISVDEQAKANISSYTHLLTAIPCPRTNTYAIAIHANPQSKRKAREKKQNKLKLDPFFVDLCPSSGTRLGYRMNLTSNKSGTGNELLLKALGMKKMQSSDKQQLVIYDLTAGLARDSMIMLSSIISDVEESIGQSLRLHMVERDPLVASLLKDAIRRLDILANLDPSEGNIAKLLSNGLSMEEGDAHSVLERMLTDARSIDTVPYPPDIVYLDPMFPPRKKKASAVKKDMAMLHSLLGTATMSNDTSESEEVEKARLKEEQELLVAACNAAKRKVVVKRPANALPLGACGDEQDDDIPMPSYDVRGNINRWDVYIIC